MSKWNSSGQLNTTGMSQGNKHALGYLLFYSQKYF